jgi:predicted nuclease of restriction endonuclease-like (RecB) superfamily
VPLLFIIFPYRNFYIAFNDENKIATLSQRLSWSHFVELLTIEDKLKRDFYLHLNMQELWSVRTLRERISSMLFVRTALSKKSEKRLEQELDLLKAKGILTPDLVFRDHYILDFLNLKDTYSENDLHSAILNQLQKFIIELGTDLPSLHVKKEL